MEDNRVVLIKGNGSEWYEHVIFILKSPTAAKTKNLVYEAEKIINDYMLSGKTANPRIELYKNSIAKRVAANRQNAPSSTVSLEYSRAEKEPLSGAVKRTSKRKIDFTSLFINICLVLSSILLGYIIHKATSP